MTPQTKAWSRGLREFIANCRQKLPYRARKDFRDAEEWQCRIIGGSFISWLRQHGPNLIQERAFFADYEKLDKEPIIVFTSEESGLVASQEILEGDSSRVLPLYPAEYARWLDKRPDEKFQCHIHTWSYFTELDEDAFDRAQKSHQITDGETYWLHKEGTTCGPAFGRGGDHLWKWDGEKPVLLEEAFNQWVS